MPDLVERLGDAVGLFADQAVEVALAEPTPAEATTNPVSDANSRAEQLRGLFDTARVGSDDADAPLAVDTESQASETEEEATRNA